MTTQAALGAETILASVARTAATQLAVGEPLTPGAPARDSQAIATGAASVMVSFTGAASGDLLITVDDEVATALATSSLGELDLAAALEPIVETVASGIGQVVLGPVQVVDTHLALNRLLAHSDAAVLPLLGSTGVRAGIALAITSGDRRAATAVNTAAAAFAPELVQAQRLDLLRGVEMEATAELGRARMTINDLLSLRSGAVIELDRAAGAPADLYVNGRLIAHAEVVVVDENYGLRITQIVADAANR